MKQDRTAERLRLLKAIDKEISRFDRECSRKEHTDTGDAWDVLYWIQRKVKEIQEIK